MENVQNSDLNEEMKGQDVVDTSKYLDLISKSKSEQDQEQLELYNEESRQNVDADILATKKEIAQVKRELASMKSQKPLKPKETIMVSQKLRALNNGLQALQDLRTELF